MSVIPDTIAVALGRTASLTAAEDAQWAMWIDDALMLIQARVDVTDGVEMEDLDPAKLDYVVREAVVAQARRPDDATQVAITVDDGSVSRTYRSGAGRVQIRDEWWGLLLPGVGESGKAYSIDTAPGGFVVGHSRWCARTFGAAWCSCGADIADHPIFEVEE